MKSRQLDAEGSLTLTTFGILYLKSVMKQVHTNVRVDKSFTASSTSVGFIKQGQQLCID